MKISPLFLFGLLILSSTASCTPVLPTAPATVLQVQYSFSTQPWLSELYECGGNFQINAEQRALVFMDLTQADLTMRIGEISDDQQAYQIGTEEILVVVNTENPVTALTASEVVGLFTGSIRFWKEIGGDDAPVQVWVYPPGEDIQQLFTQSALGGLPTSTQARLASGANDMLGAIADDPFALGIMTRRTLTSDVAEVYSAASVPVLVILREEPPEPVADLLACLQK